MNKKFEQIVAAFNACRPLADDHYCTRALAKALLIDEINEREKKYNEEVEEMEKYLFENYLGSLELFTQTIQELRALMIKNGRWTCQIHDKEEEALYPYRDALKEIPEISFE